jgi:hypothetical protein
MDQRNPGAAADAALAPIAQAFAERAPPIVLTDSMQLTDGEYAEVMSFKGLRWQDVTFEQVQRCPDAVFWFSPEAFCYCLPGILSAALREAAVSGSTSCRIGDGSLQIPLHTTAIERRLPLPGRSDRSAIDVA